MKKKAKKQKTKQKPREKRKRGNSCLQWLVMGWKARQWLRMFSQPGKDAQFGVFLQLIVPQMCQREQGLPLWPLLWVFGDSAEGDSDPGATSLCPALKGFQSWNPKAKLCSPTGSELTLSAWIAIKKTPQKTLGKLCQERPQFLCQPSLVQPPLRESSESLTNSQIFGHYSFKLLSVKE